jgi:hypothetical protein
MALKRGKPVDTENSVRIENAGFRSVREIIIVSTMTPFFIALLALVASTFRTRAAQQAEIVALRHQIAVLQQSAPRRLRLRQSDRLLWIWLSRFWPGWRQWLRILKPDTVARLHRRAFAFYWTCKSRRRPGRPRLAAEIRDLIQQMSQANFLWGAPRIQKSRTHLALAKDAPEPRAVDRPENGRIAAILQVGGLHHRYERRAA